MLGYYLANLCRHGRLDPVEYYPCPQYRVVYVENAKVACTAIKQALYPASSHAQLGQDHFHEILRAKAHHRPPPGTQDYLYFTFVREPLARFLSCYRDKIAGSAHDAPGHGTPGIFHTRFHRTLHLLLARIDTGRSGLSPDDFAIATARMPDRLRDRHVMSQTPIHRAVMQARHGFIGHFENLAQDWEMLATRYGLPPLPTLNPSTRPDTRPGSAPPALSSRGKAALARAYRTDFIRLGYRLPEIAP